MTSIQDVANAAYRIRQNADTAQRRAVACADGLKRHASQLQSTVQGSRTGEDAVKQVTQAQQKVLQSAARLATLQSTIDHFIKDLTK